jgi:hypothetical protein
LTAAQIVEKNVAARGGLDAWRKIQTMAWAGHVEKSNGAGSSLPFVLELKRPDKTRFEIHVQNQRSVRMYDGTQGWKLRQASSGSPDLQPFTPDELNFARDAQGIDGPLMDYLAKGNDVELEGVNEVEGNKAYRLSVKLPSGASRHVWINAQTFLDIKYDREAHDPFGATGIVSVYYRNYHTVDGLQIPYLIESGGADASGATNRMVIDRVALNPPLDDGIFAKPNVPEQHKAIAVSANSQRVIKKPGWPGTPLNPGNLGRPNPGSLPGSGHAQ